MTTRFARGLLPWSLFLTLVISSRPALAEEARVLFVSQAQTPFSARVRAELESMGFLVVPSESRTSHRSVDARGATCPIRASPVASGSRRRPLARIAPHPAGAAPRERGQSHFWAGRLAQPAATEGVAAAWPRPTSRARGAAGRTRAVAPKLARQRSSELRFRLLQNLRLCLGVKFGLAVPQMEVAFAGQSVTSWARPLGLFSAGLAVSWGQP
jgi:hypothetical protein